MEGNNGSDTASPRNNTNNDKSNSRVKNMHSQTVGKRGPVLAQDTILHETLEGFVHTKIIERPVHVKGFGAFGYFETVYSMAQ